MKLPMQHSTSRHRSRFFSRRVINLWNQLSEERVSATSTDMLKSHLDMEWLCPEFLYNWEAADSRSITISYTKRIFFVTGPSQGWKILISLQAVI